MITPIGFLDTTAFTAYLTLKYRERMQDGILDLRIVDPDDIDPLKIVAAPILKEWKSARLLLKRIENEAALLLKGPAELGRAWVETLMGGHGAPWRIEDDEYGQGVLRTRTCLIAAPDAYVFSGTAHAMLGVGVVNTVEHRILHSEVNFGAHPSTHLIVDIFRPSEADET